MDDKELLEDVENEIIDIEETPDVEETEVIIPKDYTTETLSVRNALRYRVPFALLAVVLFFIIKNFDRYIIFNPINSSAFIIIATIVFLFLSVIIIIDVTTLKKDYHYEKTYKQFKAIKDLFEFVSVVPYLLLLLTVMNAFFFSFSPINGTSMEPNFSDDEAVFFSHLSNDYERFDVVIVYIESLSDPYLIKRVIGLPGETVVIDDNEIYINGELIEQSFIDQDIITTKCIKGGDQNYCSFELGPDEYFVLGDNRDGHALEEQISGYSIDSRTFFGVESEDIYGKVVFKFRDYNLLN